MQDYSFSKNQQNKFIKNYKIVDGYIVINLANNEKEVLPHSEENEDMILEIMEGQIQDLDSIKFFLWNNLKIDGSLLSVFIILSILFSSVHSLSVFPTNALILATGLSLTGIPISLYKFINSIHKVQDVNKTIYYKENEEEINMNLKKTVEPNVNVEKNLLNLNKIDIENWSLQDLKTIRETIVDEDIVKEHEKERTLTLNIKDNKRR